MSAQDKQMDGDTGPQTQENDLALREQWTRRWASFEDCVGIDEDIAYRCERDARLAIICHETLVFVRPRKPSPLPRRNSIHVRERAAAMIKEFYFFWRPVLDQIAQGMDHFESVNPYTAKDFKQRAQQEIDNEWKLAITWWATVNPEKRRKADRMALEEAWNNLERMKNPDWREREAAVKSECHLIVMFFRSVVEKKKREEYEKTFAYSVMTKCLTITQAFRRLLEKKVVKEEAVQEEVVYKTWSEMNIFEKWSIMLGGPCSGIQVPLMAEMERNLRFMI